jgi:UDP-N-acetylglucosamine:LPS N-acetylglucosamine transferase
MSKATVALVSSLGGHSGQMKIICTQEVLGNRTVLFITEKQLITKEYKEEKKFLDAHPVYYFRKDYLGLWPQRYITTCWKLYKLFKKERVDIVITNGAHLSIPAVLAAKFLNKKVIFIETFIRVKTPTLTGRFCYFFSDVFLVQHKKIAQKYGVRAIWRGSVL